MKEHGSMHTDPNQVYPFLGLPLGFKFAEWGPINIFDAKVLVPQLSDRLTSTGKFTNVFRGEKALLQDR